jgi:exopolysaccharide biosynthesis polyprenyl glycosylphosphotransferase
MCKRLLVVGDGKLVDFLKKRAQSDHYQKLQFLPPLANADILKFVMDHQIHEVIVTQMLGNKQDLIQLAETLDASDITLRIVPNLLESHMGELQIDLAMGLPMMRLRHISLSGTHFAIKRIVDVLFCCGVFIIGSIPLALIALLIKLDSRGPVFYKQTRVGYKGNLFQLYKFRTMVQDAEKLLDSIRSQNERAGSVFKMRNDPRVTRVGRWLRRFSLDEVPQFINVIKGEMSVIGPRPPLPKEVAEYPPIAKKRLNVLPGLTGLWQVNGRADLDFDQMVVLDLYYIEHWSLGLDMTIILKTPYAMLSARGAY